MDKNRQLLKQIAEMNETMRSMQAISEMKDLQVKELGIELKLAQTNADTMQKGAELTE